MKNKEICSIEPLLTKTRQLLTHYDKATDLNSAVLDRSGNLIKITDFEKQLRFCELCRKYFHNPSRIWRGDEYPCDKIHLDALAESRQTGRDVLVGRSTHLAAARIPGESVAVHGEVDCPPEASVGERPSVGVEVEEIDVRRGLAEELLAAPARE